VEQEISFQKRLRYDENKICGARLRNKPGRICRHIKGFKTDHPGVGRCFLHGGLTKAGKERLAQMKEARKKQPSPFETMSIDELAEHYAKDPDILNLSRDIGIAEALLHRIDKDSPENWTTVSRLIDTITKAKRAKFEIEKERRYVLPVADVQRIVQLLFTLISKYVAEEMIKQRLFEEFRREIQSPLLPQVLPASEQRQDSQGFSSLKS